MTPSAYEVDGTTSSGVPEPSTTVLFGSAVLVGLFALRRPLRQSTGSDTRRGGSSLASGSGNRTVIL
jgi:hypothetical protein